MTVSAAVNAVIKDETNTAVFSQLLGDLLATGAGFRFQAIGRSMIPSIQDGEILHVQPADPKKLRVGQIVLFQKDGQLRAHRIVGRKKELFLTRGDSSVTGDGAVSSAQILGKVVASQIQSNGRLVTLSGTRDRTAFFWRQLKQALRARCTLQKPV